MYWFLCMGHAFQSLYFTASILLKTGHFPCCMVAPDIGIGWPLSPRTVVFVVCPCLVTWPDDVCDVCPRGRSCCPAERAASGTPRLPTGAEFLGVPRSLSVSPTPPTLRPPAGLVAGRFVPLFPVLWSTRCSGVGFSARVAGLRAAVFFRPSLRACPDPKGPSQPSRLAVLGGRLLAGGSRARYTHWEGLRPRRSQLTWGAWEPPFQWPRPSTGQNVCTAASSWGQKCHFSGTPRFIRRVLGWEERNWHPDSLHLPCLRLSSARGIKTGWR